MHIGLLKETKNHEYRVALTPTDVQVLLEHGHKVWVEKGAGAEIGFSDEAYAKSGATIADADEIFSKAEIIVKVKELQAEECVKLKQGQILLAFLHLAANPRMAELLLASGCIAFAYETVTDNLGGLPLLAPMSEIAGRLAVQEGAYYLKKTQGGRGILLGGLTGVPAAKVLILGAGNVGRQALRVALGLGAEVTILNKSLERLKTLADTNEKIADGRTINIGLASQEKVAEEIKTAALVIGAVLQPAASTPKIVTRAMIKTMQAGSVVVDVSIDQGGCFETSRATTHSDPVYKEEEVIHYCVTNMPGAVPLTASLALSHLILPLLLQIADLGYEKACIANPNLLQGLNIWNGAVTHPIVAENLGKAYVSPKIFIN